MRNHRQEWATLAGRIGWALDRDPRSQKEIAEAMGISAPRLTEWRNETKRPELDNVVALADVLDVSVGWLANNEGPPDRKEPSENPQVALDELRRKLKHLAQMTDAELLDEAEAIRDRARRDDEGRA